jgi:hypothetical protein
MAVAADLADHRFAGVDADPQSRPFRMSLPEPRDFLLQREPRTCRP